MHKLTQIRCTFSMTRKSMVLPLKIMVKTLCSFTLYSHHQYMLFQFIYLLAKLSSWFTQFYVESFNKVICLIRLNHFPTMFLKRYQTHGSQFSFFFSLFFLREERFHIKPVIFHSLKGFIFPADHSDIVYHC